MDKPDDKTPEQLWHDAMVRPWLAISRFQATLAQAVGQPGIGADEAGFLADLQALLNYIDLLEKNQPTDLGPASVPWPKAH